MRFRVELERPVEPSDEAPISLPDGAMLVSEYFIEAKSREDVIAQFDAAKRKGLSHLQGQRIRCIEPCTKLN
jgi:hypothetical protein